MAADIVVIAIVSYGRPADVIACLAALSRSSFTGFEIVIVENAGAAAFGYLAAALEKSFADRRDAPDLAIVADPRRVGAACVRWRDFRLAGGQPVRVIEASDNLGYGGGINVALRCVMGVAGWRGVWVLNPDTEPTPSALEILVNYAERGDYGLVGCRLVFSGQNRIQMRGGRWRRLIGRGKSLGYGEAADAPADVAAIERQMQWISGAALYATRRFVEAVGPMSEQYFLYCEDVDWALRRGAFRLGYAHDAIVNHAHGTTIGSAASIGARSDLSVYLTERNKLLLTRDRFPALYPLVVVAAFCLTFDYLVRGNRRVFAAASRGWRAGLRGESGRPVRL